MGRAAAALTVTMLLALAPAAGADSLPSVAAGHRPGPDALYQPAPEVPQLDNSAPWKAEPILVSGATSYRNGEFLYQDWLLDDHGAAGAPDPNTPFGAGPHLFSPTAGTFTYPTDPVYANNAADLVELRVKPLADATAFRVTLDTLIDPERTAFTIALGGAGAAVAWPHGAGVSSPADLFLTVHGAKAELLDAASGAAKAPAPTATVDRDRLQIDVRVPHAAWDPGTGKVRMTIGVGLWDPAAGTYLAPTAGSATATAPGGAGPTQTAIVNVGPRMQAQEPMPDVTSPAAPVTIGDSAAGAAVQAAWWRERAQADALRLGDVSSFFADVDFGKLAAGTRDDSGVPRKGPMNRILPSAYGFGQGIDPSKLCFDLASSFSAGSKCIGRFVGRLQSYALYVPDKPMPPGGWGMTLLLHSLSANYNQYLNSNNQSQLGDREGGSLVLTPGGRGPDGFYAGIAEADTFEAWADVARLYKLDPDWSVVSGYSMGGFGTYRLLARWPDLFARGQSTVGIPGTVDDQIASLRNTPIMAWNADADELVNIQDSEAAQQALGAAGLRFTEWLFTDADHLTLSTNDEYGPAAAFLGNFRVDRNPPHVTYVVDPTEDSAEAKTVGDHAYWLSGIAVRDPKAAQTGTIDVLSEAFGVGDPTPTGVMQGAGALQGGSHGPMAYVERKQDWGPAPAIQKRDRLVVKATNVATATVSAARARVSCHPELDISSDGPLDLLIACPPATAGKACGPTVTVKLPRVKGRRITSVQVRKGKRTVKRVRGRNLRRVVVARPPEGKARLRLVLHVSGKGVRQVVVRRSVAACG